jgi:D-3-phosphoglycerate dehydrogenase
MSNTIISPEDTPLEKRTFFPKHAIKVLLLEGLHEVAINAFKSQTFQVESLSKSLSTEQLKEKIAEVHIVGIRSKTTLTKEVLQVAKKLKAIGCFCIGTDQVDLEEAEVRGVRNLEFFSHSRFLFSILHLQIQEVWVCTL